jgi:hypothetical protein
MPEDLASKLLHRFSSSEGYIAPPGIPELLRKLKVGGALVDGRSRGHFDRVVLGVITNSDDRVPLILSSLGFRVAALRAGQDITAGDPSVLPRENVDLEFVCMSYNVGFEKPHGRLFQAAEEMALHGLTAVPEGNEEIAPLDSWSKVLVGDEYEKDVVGALTSGWDAVLIGAEAASQSTLRRVEDVRKELPTDVLNGGVAIRASGIQEVVEWLM